MGTDQEAVAHADRNAPDFIIRVDEPVYNSGPLLEGHWYYWRVDAVKGDGSIITGNVWSFQVFPKIPNTNPHLVLWYPFERGYGETVLDWSGRGNHGLCSGTPQWSEGIEDSGGMSFDGIDDYIQLLRSVQNDFTIMCWIKASIPGVGNNTSQAYEGDALIRSDKKDLNNDFMLAITNTKAAWSCGNPDQTIHSNSDISTDQWLHIAATRKCGNNGYMELYINGRLEARISHANPHPLDANPDIVIGGNVLNGRFYNGFIDEVKIFDEVRTETQIQDDMLLDPRKARSPRPLDEADQEKTVELSWRSSDLAEGHNVWFGNSPDTLEFISENQQETYYDVGLLTPGQDYYWRIDEIIGDDILTGDLWSFHVAEYFIIDNFETYSGETGQRVWEFWSDGYSVNQSGSTAGYPLAPYIEQTGFGGTHSLPFFYDNTGTFIDDHGRQHETYYSEITYTYYPMDNWTRQGITSLSIRFFGQHDNTLGALDKLYVILEDVSGVTDTSYYQGPNIDVQHEFWHEWNIDLSEFNVQTSNVQSITLGMGDRSNKKPGQQGMILIDAIRLYKPRCLAEVIKPAADLNNDCIVDFQDLSILTDHWLTEGSMVWPTDPGTQHLKGAWGFDEDLINVVNHKTSSMGNESFPPVYVSGHWSHALKFDGINDYVELDEDVANLVPELDSFTLSLWINPTRLGGPWQRMIDLGSTHTEYLMFALFRGDAPGSGMRMAVSPPGEGETFVDGNTPVPYSEWHHVAATLDAATTTARIYLDGQLDGENTHFDKSPSLIVNPTTQNWLGRSQHKNHGLYAGLMDDVHIYDRALTHGEIAFLADSIVTTTLPGQTRMMDINHDAAVDARDFAVLANEWLTEILWP